MKVTHLLENIEQPHKRMFDELSTEEQSKLISIKKIEDIKTVRFVDQWQDDHLPCVGVIINGVPISFWWLNPSFAAALHYPKDPIARKRILTLIKETIRINKEIKADEIRYQEHKKMILDEIRTGISRFRIKWDIEATKTMGGRAHVYINGLKEPIDLGVHGGTNLVNTVNAAIKNPGNKKTQNIIIAQIIKQYTEQ